MNRVLAALAAALAVKPAPRSAKLPGLPANVNVRYKIRPSVRGYGTVWLRLEPGSKPVKAAPDIVGPTMPATLTRQLKRAFAREVAKGRLTRHKDGSLRYA